METQTDPEKNLASDIKADRAASPVDIRRMSTESAAAAQKILEHSGDHDEAMKAFVSGEVIEVDEATNKRLLRRIDLHMMPYVCP
jgi:MFS transporter, ACS family, allantoate permease